MEPLLTLCFQTMRTEINQTLKYLYTLFWVKKVVNKFDALIILGDYLPSVSTGFGLNFLVCCCLLNV